MAGAMGQPEVFIQVGEQTVSGRVVLASQAFDALVVEIDEPLIIDGNWFVGNLPLLKKEGVYRDILTNGAVLVKWAGLMQ